MYYCAVEYCTVLLYNCYFKLYNIVLYYWTDVLYNTPPLPSDGDNTGALLSEVHPATSILASI